MKPSKRFGKFGCIPLEPGAGWRGLPHYSRLVGNELMAHADQSGDVMRIDVDLRNWEDELCFKMHISGRDRRNAKGVFASLLELGLMTLGERSVLIHEAPVEHQSDSQRAPVGLPTSTSRASKTNQILGITRITSDRSEKNRTEQSRSERVSAGAIQPTARRPLPPEPAEIPKMVPEIFRNPEPSAADLAAIRVWGIYLSTCGSAAFNKAPSAGELATCAEVVGWAASVEGVDLERATRELLRAWRSDDWVAAKKPPFTNLSRNLLERDAPKAAAEIRKQLAEEKRVNARPDAEVTERDPQLIRPSFAFIYGEGGTLDRRYDDPAAGAAYEDAVRKRKGGSGEVAKGPVDADRASGQAVVPRMVG